MKKKLIFFTIVFGLILACSKSDELKNPISEVETINNAPSTFDLLSPMSDANREPLLPTFLWKTSRDSEGDTVVYDLYVGTETDPQTRLASSIVDTTFVPTANL